MFLRTYELILASMNKPFQAALLYPHANVAVALHREAGIVIVQNLLDARLRGAFPR